MPRLIKASVLCIKRKLIEINPLERSSGHIYGEHLQLSSDYATLLRPYYCMSAILCRPTSMVSAMENLNDSEGIPNLWTRSRDDDKEDKRP